MKWRLKRTVLATALVAVWMVSACKNSPAPAEPLPAGARSQPAQEEVRPRPIDRGTSPCKGADLDDLLKDQPPKRVFEGLSKVCKLPDELRALAEAVANTAVSPDRRQANLGKALERAIRYVDAACPEAMVVSNSLAKVSPDGRTAYLIEACKLSDLRVFADVKLKEYEGLQAVTAAVYGKWLDAHDPARAAALARALIKFDPKSD